MNPITKVFRRAVTVLVGCALFTAVANAIEITKIYDAASFLQFDVDWSTSEGPSATSDTHLYGSMWSSLSGNPGDANRVFAVFVDRPLGSIYRFDVTFTSTDSGAILPTQSDITGSFDGIPFTVDVVEPTSLRLTFGVPDPGSTVLLLAASLAGCLCIKRRWMV